jgi:hypothetical protein
MFKTKIRAAFAAAVLLASVTATAQPTHANILTDSATAAATWLSGKLERDGGLNSGFSKGSDIGATADAILAWTAAGVDNSTLKSASGRSPIDFLNAQARSNRKITVGQWAKIALAMRAASQNPRSVGGRDALAEIRAGYNANTGVIGDSVFVHALAILALARNGESIPQLAVSTLEGLQARSGGWAFSGEGPADVDTTAPGRSRAGLSAWVAKRRRRLPVSKPV